MATEGSPEKRIPDIPYSTLVEKGPATPDLEAYQGQLNKIGDAYLERYKGAAWAMVLGRRVFARGTMRNYPTDEDLKRVGETTGLIPVVSTRDMVIEEGASMHPWTPVPSLVS